MSESLQKQKQAQSQFDFSQASVKLMNEKLEQALKVPNLPKMSGAYLFSLKNMNAPWKSILEGRKIDFVLNFQNDGIKTDQIQAHINACKILNRIPGFKIENANIHGGFVVKISMDLSESSKQILRSTLTSYYKIHPLSIHEKQELPKFEVAKKDHVNTSALDNIPYIPNKEISKKEKIILPKTVSTRDQNTQTIADFVFPNPDVKSLKNGELKNHIIEMKKEFESGISNLTHFMDQISFSGTVTCTLHNANFGLANASSNEFARISLELSSAKIGLTKDGSVFMLIPQSDMNKINSEQQKHETTVGFPEYVTTVMPQGAEIILDCSRKNGKWRVSNLLNKENSQEKLSSVYLSKKHYFAYLIDQNKNFSVPPEFKQSCGAYPTLQSAFNVNPISSQKLLSALKLLEDGEGKIDKVWVENQLFFSFSNFTTKHHLLVFGQNGGEYFVVDSQTQVRGKGKSKLEAINDLAKSGYTQTGVYYLYNKQQAGSEKTTLPTEVLAVPAKNSWAYDALKKASAGAQAGYFFSNPYVQGTAIVGTLTQIIMDEFERSDRAFHKGNYFKWERADAYFLAADLSFISGLAINLAGSKFRAISQIPKLANNAELVGFLGFSGLFSAGASEVKSQLDKSRIDSYNKVGMPIVSNGPATKNWNELGANLLNTLSSLSDKYSSLKKEDLRLIIESEWIPYLKAAHLSLQPLGRESVEVTFSAMQSISERSDWISKNQQAISNMATLLNCYNEDVVLEILMFGGPKIEKTERETLALIGRLNSKFGVLDVFDLSADFILNTSKYRNSGVNKTELANSIKMDWIRGEISTSQLYNWTLYQANFNMGSSGRTN